jgi:hypothetical protein
MIKRPLDKRFSQAVLDGRKFTTIRNNPWPIGKPVMLYNWSEKPYRSPQIDVAAIEVVESCLVGIAKMPSGHMRYNYSIQIDPPLWQCEGFDSREDMDAWFSPMVKPGESITKSLMRFHLLSR